MYNSITTITETLIKEKRGLFADTAHDAEKIKKILNDNSVEFDDDWVGPRITRFTISETTRQALELHNTTKHIFEAQE